jgi:outer membrane murein-binding lipoprotein Lpp
MKKVLIFPVLFSVLFLGGCSGYYSQNQANALIQQQTAANKAEIDTLKQQASDLQNKVNDLMQKASTTTPQTPAKGKYVTYLISKESTTKYCSGDVTDNSDAYRKTITTEVESNIPVANVASGAISKTDLVKQILALSANCGQANLNSLDIKVVNGVVEIPPIDGWAGISITMCSCIPQVEVNLLHLPGITKVVWGSR